MMPNWTPLRCGECGIEFCVPDYFNTERLQRKLEWYCPNGHSRIYAESESDKLRRQLQRVEQENARLVGERDQAEARATREQKARLRIEKRVQAGVCPHCTRHFMNLHRHMAHKHKTVDAGSQDAHIKLVAS